MKTVIPLCLSALLVSPLASQAPLLPFTYMIHPCYAGERGTVEINVDTSRFLEFYYFLCHSEGSSFVYDVCSYFRGNREFLNFHMGIPESVTAKGAYHIEFGIQDNDPRVGGPSRFSVRIAQDLTTAERLTDVVVSGDSEFRPNRKLIIYDEKDPDAEREVYDYYKFEGFEVPLDPNTRKFGFANLNLAYCREGKELTTLFKGDAELRLLNHIDEFPGLGEAVGNTYRSIPLRIYEKQRNKERIDLGFRLQENHYYSKKDFSLASTAEGSFASNDLYVPLRQGHDTDQYRYQIFLRELSSNNDSFRIEGSTQFARRYFGSHQETEYGVFIGDGNDA